MTPIFPVKKWLLFSVVIVLILSGCATTTPSINTTSDRYWLNKGSLASATGCIIHYTRYQPRLAIAEHTLILGHGFLRNLSNMAGLASAVAESGVAVVTLDYCNMRFFNAHHEKNAHDMIMLARHLGLNKPVYGGFSAGALAALVAGASDRSTVAVLVLDLVDDAGLTNQALALLDKPVFALAGAPSACNRRSSASMLFNQFDHVQLKVIENASHCDFEMPTNALCELVCGKSESRLRNIARALVVKTATDIVTTIARGDDAQLFVQP